MNSDPQILIAYVTFPSEASAREICERLVREGTIACANLFAPIQSIYIWDGQLQQEAEHAAFLKTSVLKKEALKERIRAIHPYANPCLLFLRPEDGLPDFQRWVYAQTL